MANRRPFGQAAGLLGLCLLAGCTGSIQEPAAITPSQVAIVTVTTNTCNSGWLKPSAGLQTFQIHNTSPLPADVSLIDPQTGGIYAEVEALGPGTARAMQVDVSSGTYEFECDNGNGSPLTSPTFVVPGDSQGGQAVVPPSVATMLTAVRSDRTYITKGLATVAQQVATLQADITAGDLTAARGAWLTAHLSFERLGSAYGMFNDFDDEIDGPPFGLPGGVDDPSWTGFYRIEYGLWHEQPASELSGPVRQLSQYVRQLRAAFPGMALYPQAALSDLALRTHEILEHAIRFQLSGEDDFGSGTTLATLDANIGATRTQLAMLRPILSGQYANLPALDASLDKLQQLVEAEYSSSGWTPVSALTTTQREARDSPAAETVQLLAPIAVMFDADPIP
jgi:iron uptake system EfeUOB component EfeO/EfeM